MLYKYRNNVLAALREITASADIISEMEKILQKKDAFKRYQRFRKNYRESDYAGRFDHEADNIEELRESFEDVKDRLTFKSASGGIKIYRSIRIADYSDSHYTLNFFKNLMGKQIFVTRENKTNHAGIYWSYDPKGSRVYWADSGAVTKFIAVAPTSSVDIEATLWITFINPREKEIRLKKGSPVKITNVQTYYKGKDKEKISKVLKKLPVDVIAALRKVTASKEYPAAGASVDGLKVTKNIPNQDSISATYNDYEVLEGVREIPMKGWGKPEQYFYAKNDLDHAKDLAKQIDENGWIDPLIIAYDLEADEPYLLEGGHRYAALYYLGKKAFPALVVYEKEKV